MAKIFVKSTKVIYDVGDSVRILKGGKGIVKVIKDQDDVELKQTLEVLTKKGAVEVSNDDVDLINTRKRTVYKNS